jgi:hypothetical protein
LKRKGAKLSQHALSALLGQIKRERARYKRSKPELVFKRYKILIGYQYKMQACGNGLRRSDLNGFVGTFPDHSCGRRKKQKGLTMERQAFGEPKLW